MKSSASFILIHPLYPYDQSTIACLLRIYCCCKCSPLTRSLSGPAMIVKDGNGEWVSGSAGRTRSRSNGARRFCPVRYGGLSRGDPRPPVIMRAASTVTGSLLPCLVALIAEFGHKQQKIKTVHKMNSTTTTTNNNHHHQHPLKISKYYRYCPVPLRYRMNL